MNETTASLTDEVKDYVETKIEVVKLKAISKIAPLAGNIILGIVLLVLGIFTIMFLSFSAAYAISFATDKPYLGFLLVGCFHLALAITAVVLKDKLLTIPIMRALLESIYYPHDSHKNKKKKS